jgi:hypothetical protein
MNQKTKDMFFTFMEYIDSESQQIGEELLDAYREDELGCVYEFSSEFIGNYLTQYTNEIYKLTKDDPMPAYACLTQRMMLLKAQYCLVNQMMKMLAQLHPEEFYVTKET